MKCRSAFSLVLAVVGAVPLDAQPPGKWPPDSLINTRVIAHNTPVTQVWGMMRTFAAALGVECQYCHVGEENAPLAQINYVSDEKRTKLVARQMLEMVQEVNRRLDTIPRQTSVHIAVTCTTCHRGIPKPIPLVTVLTDAAIAANGDSAIRAYRSFRQKYYGKDAYDFSEFTLNATAFRTARAGKIDDAFAILKLNEELFPRSSAVYLFRGNVLLMKGDTASAERAFRESVRRDSTSEAVGRLKDIGRRR
jgi:hypothetical protein